MEVGPCQRRGLRLGPRQCYLWLQVLHLGKHTRRLRAAAVAGLRGPAVSLSPRLQHLRLQLAREQQESSSQPESPVGESQSLHSDYSRVSLPFPLVLGHEGLHCWTRGSGWGLCFSRFSPGMLTSVSDPLLSPRLDHRRGPPLPHNAPLLEPHPARQHQVSLAQGGRARACLQGGSPRRHPHLPPPHTCTARVRELPGPHY